MEQRPKPKTVIIIFMAAAAVVVDDDVPNKEKECSVKDYDGDYYYKKTWNGME